MNNIVDLDNQPYDIAWHAKIKRWVSWRKIISSFEVLVLLLGMVIVILFAFGVINVSLTNSEKINLLLTETSIQLQAIADGCLKGGE
jgi:uncharacterized BrkB/YihY/UPF0761 family membrane protein